MFGRSGGISRQVAKVAQRFIVPTVTKEAALAVRWILASSASWRLAAALHASLDKLRILRKMLPQE